jgi:hypothetical protein
VAARRHAGAEENGLMADPFFSSRHNLEERFSEGLAAMLDKHHSLGAYILVLANVAQDPGLWDRLREVLVRRHRYLSDRITAALREGRKLAEPEDDLMVFLKLLAIGFEYLAPVEQKLIADTKAPGAPVWEAQFNPIRALRPARMSDTRVDGLMRPFDPRGFHFNKPFLAKEVLWEGELENRPSRLLYNKFPFAPLHGLLVPEPARECPQFLTPELHGWAWDVARTAGTAIPGFGMSYNSYGAYASVNHLHFQTFVRDRPLPAQHGLDLDYPLARLRFTDREAAWFHLDELHRRGLVYNLVYSIDGVLVILRARQGEIPPEPWSAGFAWSEVAGVFPLASREDYDGLDHAALGVALSRLAV